MHMFDRNQMFKINRPGKKKKHQSTLIRADDQKVSVLGNIGLLDQTQILPQTKSFEDF